MARPNAAANADKSKGGDTVETIHRMYCGHWAFRVTARWASGNIIRDWKRCLECGATEILTRVLAR